VDENSGWAEPAVEIRVDRRGHAHVVVEGAGDLMLETGLTRLPAESAQTQLACFRINHRAHVAGAPLVGVGHGRDRSFIEGLEQPWPTRGGAMRTEKKAGVTPVNL